MNKLKEKILKIVLALIVISAVMQQAAAFGPIAHMAIITEVAGADGLDHDARDVLRNSMNFARGGSIGQDTSFYALWGYSANCEYHSDISQELYDSAHTQQERAYGLAWSTHDLSDEQEDELVGSLGGLLSEIQVEIGVDGNVVDETKYWVSVPYGLVQEAYGNCRPSTLALISATRIQQGAIYLEKYLIKLGVFNELIDSLSDIYGGSFYQSVDGSIDAINNFYDTDSLRVLSITAVSPSIMNNNNRDHPHKVDKDIRKASYELLEEGAIDISVEIDEKNKVFHLREPVIKDNVAFDKKMKELIKKKKGKNK
jgi:hypothetical protein